MNAPLLQARKLCLDLGGRRVVDGVSASWFAGTWTAIVGPNGAGKSSLLSLLAGWREPQSGSLELDGRLLAAWTSRQRGQRIAWLSQQGETEGDLSVKDLVDLGRLPHLGLMGAPGPQDEAAVSRALEQTESLALAQRSGGSGIRTLSGGERQRVLMARTLAVQAPVLLLDEPTTHLDPPHQADLVRLMRAQAQEGRCVVSVLHDLNLALAADRVQVMVQGRIVADGSPQDEVLHQALTQAFEGALRIVNLSTPEGTRHLAVPIL